MPVEDTDFSPSATAVMFLLTIHLTTLEKGDFLSTGVKVTDGADYASQDYHRQDCYGAVHKESIRENRDDRVGVCVEDPVVVLEENMVERDKEPFPVDSDANSKGSRKRNAENGCIEKIFHFPLFVHPKDDPYGKYAADDSGVFQRYEDDFYFFEMSSAVL